MADKTPDITDEVLDDVYCLVDMWRSYRIVNGPLGVHGEKAKEDLRLYLSGLRQPPTGLPSRKTLDDLKVLADRAIKEGITRGHVRAKGNDSEKSDQCYDRDVNALMKAISALRPGG